MIDSVCSIGVTKHKEKLKEWFIRTFDIYVSIWTYVLIRLGRKLCVLQISVLGIYFV